MDPRIEIYKTALQSGGGFDVPVFRGLHRYQYGQGIGSFLRSAFRTFFPVVMRGAKSFFKAGSDSLKSGSDISESLKAGIKPALTTVVKHSGKALGKIIAEQEPPAAAPPPEPPLLIPDNRDSGTLAAPVVPQSGKGYKKKKRTSKKKNNKRKRYNQDIYNF